MSGIRNIAIIGAGFTGLTAGYELSKKGFKVTIIEKSNEIGGLASAFTVNGTKLERFYHHWFTNDIEIVSLIKELNLLRFLKSKETKTSLFFANNFFKLSNPFDLLKFSPLSFFNRLRLGLLTLKARNIKNWQLLENKSASEWLKENGGEEVYKIIWQPLLKGKFGSFEDKVSAVWFWNKIKLRGSSRNRNGKEELLYLEGSFLRLAEELKKRIIKNGGKILLSSEVNSILPKNGGWQILLNSKLISADLAILTTPLPITANFIKNWAKKSYLSKLRKIQYLDNICLILILNKSLSDTYWLNVNDPNYPFVGLIEHTNFENSKKYKGKHIVYLSKYLEKDHELNKMNKKELLNFSMPFLKKMFPEFNETWIEKSYLWKAKYSQPVVEKNYSKLIPDYKTPYDNLYICTMAQIYPEDRGTNYAVREGRKIASQILGESLIK